MKDYTGMKFNRLTALEPVNVNLGGRHPKWLFRCECGGMKIAYIENVVAGKTKSCGCLHKERLVNRNKTHGLPRDRLYIIWKGMRQRCRDPKKDHYDRYGGRGITVCEDWEDYAVFHRWALANGYRDDLTLDRIDVDGNYCPENCRWITQKEQMQNTRATISLEIKGVRHSLAEWAEIAGVDYSLLYRRYRKGFSPEQVVYGENV